VKRFLTEDIANTQQEIDDLKNEFIRIEREIGEKLGFLRGLYIGLFLGILGNLLVSHWIIVFNAFVPESSEQSLYFSLATLVVIGFCVFIAIIYYRGQIKQFLELRKKTLDHMQKLEKAKRITKGNNEYSQ
jgi:membrane-anchored glycerophosphoryl diester phosphodiesterase (GDPDase)